MITLSSLDQVAKYLEQHENSKRIKKLIFCVCKNVWENDQHTLDRFKLAELIQELCSINPTIDQLNSSLSSVVNTLNKPGEYSLVASIIVNQIQDLYLAAEEETEIVINPPNQEEETAIVINPPNQEEETAIVINPPNQPNLILSNLPKISSTPINKPPQIPQKSPYNQFDLRQNIMKYTNPLRAKTILFSAVYHKFTFNQEDWFKLRAEKLDTLLDKLFNSCANLRELESKLNNAVISLGNPDENSQAASAIIQSMRGLYGEMSASVNSYQPLQPDFSQETISIVNINNQIAQSDDDNDFYENYDEDNNTCQIIAPPPQNILNKK